MCRKKDIHMADLFEVCTCIVVLHSIPYMNKFFYLYDRNPYIKEKRDRCIKNQFYYFPVLNIQSGSIPC